MEEVIWIGHSFHEIYIYFLSVCQQNNHPGIGSKERCDLSVTKMVVFIGVNLQVRVCYLSTVYPSVLYQTAIWPADWTQGYVIGWCEKNGGWLGQCLWGKVRGYGPLTTHVKAWLTHTLHLLNESLQPPLSAICPHLHIKQRAKWPNAGFDAKQTQWVSFPPLIRLLLCLRSLVMFHFLHSLPINKT